MWKIPHFFLFFNPSLREENVKVYINKNNKNLESFNKKKLLECSFLVLPSNLFQKPTLFPINSLALLIWHLSDMIGCYFMSVFLSVFPIIQMTDKILFWFHQSEMYNECHQKILLLPLPLPLSTQLATSSECRQAGGRHSGTDILFSNSKKDNVSEFYLIYHILTEYFLSSFNFSYIV